MQNYYFYPLSIFWCQCFWTKISNPGLLLIKVYFVHCDIATFTKVNNLSTPSITAKTQILKLWLMCVTNSLWIWKLYLSCDRYLCQTMDLLYQFSTVISLVMLAACNVSAQAFYIWFDFMCDYKSSKFTYENQVCN